MKSPRISVSVDMPVHEQLVRVAALRNVSVSSLVSELLYEAHWMLKAVGDGLEKVQRVEQEHASRLAQEAAILQFKAQEYADELRTQFEQLSADPAVAAAATHLGAARRSRRRQIPPSC